MFSVPGLCRLCSVDWWTLFSWVISVSRHYGSFMKTTRFENFAVSFPYLRYRGHTVPKEKTNFRAQNLWTLNFWTCERIRFRRLHSLLESLWKTLNYSRRKEVNMNVNVIVIGGGPAGIITALTAKSVYPEKSVCVIKEIGDGVIPCAIPYMMHTRRAFGRWAHQHDRTCDSKESNCPRAWHDANCHPSVADIRTDSASIDKCSPSGLGEIACHEQRIAFV